MPYSLRYNLFIVQKVKDYSSGQFIKDIWRYISSYKNLFFTAAFLRFTSDMAHLYPAWAISQIVQIVSDQGGVSFSGPITTILVAWIAIGIYGNFFHSFSKYLGYQVAEKASLDIYKETLSHLFKLDFAWQEKENSGNKMKRIDKGLEGVNTTVRRIFDVLIEVTVNTTGVILIFLTIDQFLAFILIIFMTVYFFIGNKLLKAPVRQERRVNKSFENLGGLTFESINNIQTIKSLGIDKGVILLVGEKVRSLFNKIRQRIFLFQKRNAALDLFETSFLLSSLFFIINGISQGKYEISLLILFVGLFQRISTSARELTDVTQQLALSKIWVSRSMALLNQVPEIENPKKVASQVSYPNSWREINLKNVDFSYKNNKVLENISFTIKRGEKVGIVGLSGAGKSTLFKLLLNLYENYDGDIFIGKTSLKDMKRQDYIDNVAVVLQDTELFDMTLRENIEIASGKSNNNLLNEVIKKSHLQKVVDRLPNGVNTVVGEKGIKLSGGQRQRLGIARALYRQPDILLLDEATSHLDSHSEKEIQNAILENVNRFTTIVIAHRLSTIRAMDKIIVLDNGKKVEEGSFEILLDKKGVFAKMWHEQKL